MATQTLSQQHPAGTIVPHELTLDLYRKMLTTHYVDERMKIFAHQGKCTLRACRARGRARFLRSGRAQFGVGDTAIGRGPRAGRRESSALLKFCYAREAG